MSLPADRLSNVATNAQIETAADAMRIVWESEEARRRGGVAWWYLALVALEAAAHLNDKAISVAPEAIQ